MIKFILPALFLISCEHEIQNQARPSVFYETLTEKRIDGETFLGKVKDGDLVHIKITGFRPLYGEPEMVEFFCPKENMFHKNLLSDNSFDDFISQNMKYEFPLWNDLFEKQYNRESILNQPQQKRDLWEDDFHLCKEEIAPFIGTKAVPVSEDDFFFKIGGETYTFGESEEKKEIKATLAIDASMVEVSDKLYLKRDYSIRSRGEQNLVSAVIERKK